MKICKDMKIPFDIKFRPQIESGEYKVLLENGHSGRVLAWDLPGDYPIAIADVDDPCVLVATYDNKGRCGIGKRHNCLFVITPEPELTEFEKAIKDLVLAIDEGELCELGVFEEENLGAWAVKKAAELLDLARKELREELQTHEDHRDSFMGLAISSAYERGKSEALKDLPRWKKAKEYKKLGPNDYCFTLDDNGKCAPYWDTVIEEGQYYITESDLEKLPKED